MAEAEKIRFRATRSREAKSDLEHVRQTIVTVKIDGTFDRTALLPDKLFAEEEGSAPSPAHSGTAAPFSIHSRILAANSSWVSGGFDLPSAGLHPDCLTKLSSETCLMISSSVLPPFCLGSFVHSFS